MLEAISATQARQQLLPILEQVNAERKRYMVTRHGKPVAVIMSYEDFSRIETTLRLFDNKELSRNFNEGLNDEREMRLNPFE